MEKKPWLDHRSIGARVETMSRGCTIQMGKSVGQIDEIQRPCFCMANNEEQKVYKGCVVTTLDFRPNHFTELTSRMPCSTSDELCTRISASDAGERNTVYFRARTEVFEVGGLKIPVESNAFVDESSIDEQASRAR